MLQVTSASCPNQQIVVSSSLNFEVAELRSMIVVYLLVVATVFAVFLEGCESNSGRPADAYYSEKQTEKA